MGEIVEAIGVTLKEEILCEVNNSPFYSIILDEATILSQSTLAFVYNILTKMQPLESGI